MNPFESKGAALQAFDRGEAVYLLYPDDTEGLAQTRSDIEAFSGFFGTEKESGKAIRQERDSTLIPVSRTAALAMWDKELDVFVDRNRATNKKQIENAPEGCRFYLPEYQYVAQLDFETGKQPTNLKVVPVEVAKAVDKAVSDSNYELYRYDLKQAAASVIAECGAERVSKVLADFVNRHDYDGRISEKNKEWAKDFETSTNRYGPVFDTHPAVLDGFITEAKSQIQKLEQVQEEKLPQIYEDRFLYASERVELHDDYRGIPETKYYNSSANAYFVTGIGWLHDAGYDREQKLSGLSAQVFYQRVTKINADYIDGAGMTGQMDMPKNEYELMTAKTYAPENAEALKHAMAQLAKRMAELDTIIEKPTEFYAVRQMNDRKYAVCSISADGLVTVVTPHIATIERAKQELLAVFERRQRVARCELVHPQTMDEKSMALFAQPLTLPDVTYRICLNPSKDASDTHFLQRYSKNADDTYKIEDVICCGNYERCNEVLGKVLQQDFSKQIAAENTNPGFAIYQLKPGDETRDLRFEPYDRLVDHGGKVDFCNYEKVYEGDASILPAGLDALASRLEALFQKFNIDRPTDFTGHSLSVSDVIVMDNSAYYVDSAGFKPLASFVPSNEKQQEMASIIPVPDKTNPQNKLKK